MPEFDDLIPKQEGPNPFSDLVPSGKATMLPETSKSPDATEVPGGLLGLLGQGFETAGAGLLTALKRATAPQASLAAGTTEIDQTPVQPGVPLVKVPQALFTNPLEIFPNQSVRDIGHAISGRESDIASGFTTPGSLLTLPAAPLSKLLQAYYLGSAAQQLPESIKEVAQAKGAPETAAAVTGALANLAMTGAMGRGLLKEGVPDASLQIGKSAEIPLAETPRDSQAVEQGIRDTEKPADAQKEEVQAKAEVESPTPPTPPTETVSPAVSLPTSEAPAPTQAQDFARYTELTQKASEGLKKGEIPSQELLGEIEQIKNRYKGMPPKAPEPPLSMGPGSAAATDRPPPPPGSTPGGISESSTPENRPLGAQSHVGTAIGKAWDAVKTFVRGAAGESMPKTTSANREVGEAGVRYASSRIAARPLATLFANGALEGTGVDPIEFGAALTEDNLRSVRESLRAKATELMAKQDQEGADKATEAANRVVTIIGQKRSPFKTEDDYFDYLSKPEVQQAIKQHAQLWKEVVEPQYKQARDLDPNVELPTRGQQTGARINLKAILPDQETKPTYPVQGGASLTGTFKKRTPFSIKAKGTGQSYDVNYHDIIANTFERQLEIANKNAFDDALVKSGNAVIDSPGKQVVIDGKPAVAFPLSRRVIASSGESFSQAKNIYVKGDLAGEYRAASNVDPRFRLPIATAAFNKLNQVALAALTDFTVHGSNLATALFNRPVAGKLFGDTLLSLTGRADIPVTLTKLITKAFQDNQEQVAELSKIGAMRPSDVGSGLTKWSGQLLKAMDRTTRLVLDDTFKSLVGEGLVEDTETNRREYVNQVGQYNRRLQGPLTRLLRDTGLGPFVTAGKTFNALGVRMATLSPGAKASSIPAAIALRANVLSKWVGASVLAATLNYLYTKSVTGRPGTPLGNIDLGTNDKSGKQQSFPLFNAIGLGRALRVTGIRGAVESKRLGLSDSDAIDSAARDLVNSWVAPAAGPPVRAGFVAASGYPPAVKVGRVSRVAPPGSSQLAENLKSAAIEANPGVSAVHKILQGKPLSEAVSTQFPRFTLSPGKTERLVKDYPKIVSMAQANEFTEDVIYQARRMPLDKRRAFVQEQVARLPANARGKALNEIARRRVFLP